MPKLHVFKFANNPFAQYWLEYQALARPLQMSMLISGMSGAGKTECCKFVLAYLIAKKESTVDID